MQWWTIDSFFASCSPTKKKHTHNEAIKSPWKQQQQAAALCFDYSWIQMIECIFVWIWNGLCAKFMSQWYWWWHRCCRCVNYVRLKYIRQISIWHVKFTWKWHRNRIDYVVTIIKLPNPWTELTRRSTEKKKQNKINEMKCSNTESSRRNT